MGRTLGETSPPANVSVHVTLALRWARKKRKLFFFFVNRRASGLILFLALRFSAGEIE